MHAELETTVGNQPYSNQFQGSGESKSNLIGQNFQRGIIVYSNVPTIDECPTNF